MSIDLNWDTLTTGPDGIALSETVRDFIHDRFQRVTLPRFIKTVTVHAFEFGSAAPEIELKDICDPLPDFYEENDEENGDEDEEDEEESELQQSSASLEARSLRERRRLERVARMNTSSRVPPSTSLLDMRLPGHRPALQTPGDLGNSYFGAHTPGISGGTSNLNSFHSQLASGLSGTQTPLAAVAGAHFPHGWPDYNAVPPTTKSSHHHSHSGSSLSQAEASEIARTVRERDSDLTLAASAGTSRPRTQDGLLDAQVEEEPPPPPRRFREPRVEDVQTVFRVRYSGDVKLSLTAEILLDYPMPSFVGIPVKLNITGLSFDGVAVLAYIRKRAHFCFLSHEDALNAVGPEDLVDLDEVGGLKDLKMGGLLQEIKVESEIGQRESGKQVLKNVGKVEKFVLEEVRRIFEDEFVYPSFWTFLV